jgi:hypothetical protein
MWQCKVAIFVYVNLNYQVLQERDIIHSNKIDSINVHMLLSLDGIIKK